MDAANPGGLGGTYGGNPLGIAAANAVLDVIEEEDLCARANELGGRLKQRLEAIRSVTPAPCARRSASGPGFRHVSGLVLPRPWPRWLTTWPSARRRWTAFAI